MHMKPRPSFPDALELRVLSGRQAGARARLDSPDGVLVCGLNPDNPGETQFADVLLYSPAEFHARLVPTLPGRLGLQLLSGSARLGERDLEPGITLHAWAPGQQLLLGGALVAYGPAGQDHWPEPVMHEGPELPSSFRAQGQRAPAPKPRPVLEGLLALAGLAMLVGGASLTLKGGTLRDAGQAIATVLPPVQAAAPTDVRHSVVEVFRLHGVAARADWSPEGELQVHTQERDNTRVQAAEAAARRDIARLPVLHVLNQPPAQTAAAPPPPPAEDPTKRLVAVVDNAESPYFITADGSRYFTGALLPSGHRVVRIAERHVVVERDGQRTQLSL